MDPVKKTNLFNNKNGLSAMIGRDSNNYTSYTSYTSSTIFGS